MAPHADARTIRLYDRRDKKVPKNVIRFLKPEFIDEIADFYDPADEVDRGKPLRGANRERLVGRVGVYARTANVNCDPVLRPAPLN
jgi:hypothetical protein